MKMLIVHPGSEWAITEVYDGLKKGLAKAGVDTIPYRLDGRIHRAASWLEHVWENRGPGSTLTQPTWGDAIYVACRDITEMAWEHEVDWVLIVSGVYLHPHVIKQLDRPRPWKVGAVFTESPYMDGMQCELAAHVDVCWTNDRASLDRIRGHNPATYYLPTGFDPEVHMPGGPPADTPAHDVVFVGAGLIERIELLEAVDWTGIDLGLYGRWPLLKEDSPLRPYLRQRTLDEIISNEQASNLYKAAKIGLNLYRTSTVLHEDANHVGGAYSLNPRAYELAATKTFQLSEYRPEIIDVFGDCLPYFLDADELGSQVRFYVEDPTHRQNLAAEQHMCIQPHSYDERAIALLDAIGFTAGMARESVAIGG